MYFSDIRRFIKQLLDASRNNDTLTITDIGGIREEFAALTHLCESLSIQANHDKHQLERVRDFMRCMDKTMGCLNTTLAK